MILLVDPVFKTVTSYKNKQAIIEEVLSFVHQGVTYRINIVNDPHMDINISCDAITRSFGICFAKLEQGLVRIRRRNGQGQDVSILG